MVWKVIQNGMYHLARNIMSKKWKSYLGIMVLICGMILLFKDILDLWNTKDVHTV
jgi:hypothetical protein